MKTTIIICILLSPIVTSAQSIVGKWQLIKQSNCIDSELGTDTENVEGLVDDMKSMGGPSAQVITFKENSSGEENTRVLSRKKTYNHKGFLYKYDGSSLYILDKKSRTILENYTVEKLNENALTISNASRPCETKMFTKIK